MKVNTKLFVNLLIILSLTSGCASFGRSMKEFLGGKTAQKTTKKKKNKRKVGRFDKTRKYKRSNHQSIQERSRLAADAGSLWIERGQGSYLFTQNTNRLIGDLINIGIEGQAKKQIETKVNVIQDLIEKIKKQQEERKLASKKRKEGRTKGKGKESAAKPAAPAPPAAKKKQKFEVKVVPSRITDILKDGSYMVKGDQPFMIGKREYKLVVQGIVRQEDFDDQGISAETLLDPKFDIVTNRSKRR